ncbi:MAG: MAPEG family protein [Betaproteobacteria bacterium]|nr:MAPEG family protein [Betaproteobacteria bacterium]
MKPELTLLGWSVVLAIVHMLAAVQGALNQVGLMTLAGNREKFPEILGWGGRAARASRNMAENLVLFAAVVLAVVAAGKTNDMTLLGAQLFFWGRIAYAVCYIGGIKWLRTLSWLVSIIGVALILIQLL